MIDIQTGEITIGSPPVKIGPDFTSNDLALLSMPIHPLIKNEQHHSYMLGQQPMGDETFFVALYFYGKKLESIDLAIAAPELGASWDDWSEEKEMKRKEKHDVWLIAQTGCASHVYDWGEIDSAYDPRSGGSSITIRYRWLGQPWHRQDRPATD